MSSAAIALRIRKFFVHEAAAADARRAIIVCCSAGEDSGVGAVHTAAGVGADLCGVDLCGADAGRARRGAERCRACTIASLLCTRERTMPVSVINNGEPIFSAMCIVRGDGRMPSKDFRVTDAG